MKNVSAMWDDYLIDVLGEDFPARGLARLVFFSGAFAVVLLLERFAQEGIADDDALAIIGSELREFKADMERRIAAADGASAKVQ